MKDGQQQQKKKTYENSVPHHRSDSAAISGELGGRVDASAGNEHDGVLLFQFFL